MNRGAFAMWLIAACTALTARLASDVPVIQAVIIGGGVASAYVVGRISTLERR